MTTEEEWHAWRAQGIGGSDIANVLGIGKWGSPWSVWAEKVGLLPPTEANEVMEAGKWLELAIAPWFAHRTGLYVAGEQTWCTHRDHPHHRCTTDGFVVESPSSSIDDALGLLQIKSEGWGTWEEIPRHYHAQGQWEMHVTDMPRMWFAVLHGRRLGIYEHVRDQAVIDYMVAEADRFWTEHVLTGEPPPVDGSAATSDALAHVYPGGEPDAVPVDRTLVEEWRRAKRAAKDTDAIVTELENAIKASLGNHEAGEVDGKVAVTYRSQERKGGIDEAAMTADGLIVDKYRKPATIFRVLRPAGRKDQP